MLTLDDLAPQALQTLQERLRGSVLTPGDADYDEARSLWNGMFDPRPGAIARCTHSDDVIAAVNFARENGVLLSVRSTGHSYAGNSVCEGGLVIDLSAMNAVRVDPTAKKAHVQPGATWGEIDHETQAHGLATTGATVSTVGVAGYTLGGGTGYLARKRGLSLDNLLSVDVVTASGDLLHASENQNADLFWGLRGGSGNLGIVTSFEFALHEVGPEVLAGQIVYPFEQAREVLRYWRDFMAEAPEELQCYAFIIHIPPIPAFPEEFHGKTALDLVAAYVGPVADGEQVLQSLRSFGRPILDGVFPQPYTALQQTFDAGMPKGLRWYSKAHYFDRLSDDAIDTLLSYTDPLPGPYTAVYFEPGGGAVGRIDPAATAFPHREAAFGFQIFPGWADPAADAELTGWARDFYGAMAPFATDGVYVNLLGHDEEERVRAAYGRSYGRLAQLKERYDPANLFRVNHNVVPEGET